MNVVFSLVATAHLLFWRILPFIAIVPLSSILDGGSLQGFVGVVVGGRIVACDGDHGI
jgi:hypothetical protein